MSNDFKEYGQDLRGIHKIYSGKDKNNIEGAIVISTWQSIYKLPKKWFEQFFIDIRAKHAQSQCTVHLGTEVLVSDNDSVFLSSVFQDFLTEKKIAHFTSAPYTQSQNFVERDMRTLGEAAIALLKMSGFPLYLWEHAYACVVHGNPAAKQQCLG